MTALKLTVVILTWTTAVLTLPAWASTAVAAVWMWPATRWAMGAYVGES